MDLLENGVQNHVGAFPEQVKFRSEVCGADLRVVHTMVESSGFFSREEVLLAVELVEEHLRKGVSSGYRFLFAEFGGVPIGYTCFGLIPCTRCSYDLYWIVVQNDFRHLGLGGRLLRKTEDFIGEEGGCRIYVETSSRHQYAPTRFFYEHCGYSRAAVLQDFYAPGDSKVIYVKSCS